MMLSSDVRSRENNEPPSDVKVLHLSHFTKTASIERSGLRRKSSFFVPVNISYYESAEKNSSEDWIGSLDTEYIQCINKEVADFVFDGYMKKEFERKEEWAREYREWGDEKRAKAIENDIKEVSIHDWKVDRGYYLYDNYSKIIIQKDNIIYILYGNVNFSEKEIINVCRNKLFK